MIPSILLLDKPRGFTSFQLVDTVKRKFKLNKVGHTGALDPIATGLLILLLEEATRFAEFFVRLPKTYITKIVLGAITDTYDAEGNILERRDVNVSCEDVAKVLPNFTGRILQKPPPYSAKKVGGVRAYELARKGLEVPLKPVEVEVYSAKLLECNLPQVVLEFEVSGGTYIRSLAHDIGLALGCGAYVSELRRTKVGNFSVSMALSYERLSSLEDLWGVIIPIWEALSFLPAVNLRTKEARLFRNGAKIKAEADQWLKVHVKNFVEMYQPLQIAKALKSALFFVGNDSGLSHLSAYLGLPTFIFYGPTDPVVWKPIGRSVFQISLNLSCSPCFPNTCQERLCFDVNALFERFLNYFRGMSL